VHDSRRRVNDARGRADDAGRSADNGKYEVIESRGDDVEKEKMGREIPQTRLI